MAVKTKTVFRCENCEFEALRWLGQCPSCSNWNTLKEELVRKSSVAMLGAQESQALSLSAVLDEEITQPLTRFGSGFALLDAAIGGGFLEGSLVLLGGAPGVGKSTLAGQVALCLGDTKENVFYVSGEEESYQIGARLNRMGAKGSDNFFIASSLIVEAVLAKAEEIKPKLLIVDSVQTMVSAELQYASGSPSLIRAITGQLLHFAKANRAIVLLLGHVTKEGMLAGPKHLEHMVDVVLTLEKPRTEEFRFLRVAKNRFGPTNHLVVFKMDEKGFAEVRDPSESFLTPGWRQKLAQDAGREALASSIALDGGQPFLIQVEALLGKRKMSIGKRAAIGIDRTRLEMLLAVLEKTLKVSLETADIFVSCLGGAKVRDPGVDLAIFMAVASTIFEVPIPTQSVFFGEISLSGDVLQPKDLPVRIRQAKNLGFQEIYHSNDKSSHVRDFVQLIRR